MCTSAQLLAVHKPTLGDIQCTGEPPAYSEQTHIKISSDEFEIRVDSDIEDFMNHCIIISFLKDIHFILEYAIHILFCCINYSNLC